MDIEEYEFFKELTLCASSSLELADACENIYKFLAKHLPLEGIAINSYNAELRSLHLQFLVVSDNLYEVDKMIPLSDDKVNFILDQENVGYNINIPRCNDELIASKINRFMEEWIPFMDRGYLVGPLKTNDRVVGHLCLIGNAVDCFNAEHEKLIKIMLLPLCMAMINMQQYRHTQELKKRLDEQRLQLSGEVSLLKSSKIIGANSGLNAPMKMVGQLAGRETLTLIQGETGTGKEAFADLIHKVSPRANGPYIKVNCGAIPDTLIDSELFGYQKGAFTGALTARAGRFEQADGGTLFLDEIGELPLQAQVRLLRVLQNQTIDRIGGTQPIPVNVRIIAATHRSLEDMVHQGTFREDLFYRLNVFPIQIPPLRERPEDIPLLVHHFIKEISSKLKLSDDISITPDSMRQLMDYHWPGNVRELENLIERGLTLSPKGPLDITQYLCHKPLLLSKNKINDQDLHSLIRRKVEEVLAENKPKITIEEDNKGILPDEYSIKPLDKAISEYISRTLKQCNGKISGPGGAAEKLAINPSTLRKKMIKYNIPFRCT